MSKLSELLNPAPNPDSTAPTIDTETAQGRNHTRYPSITSPLEALAIAATENGTESTSTPSVAHGHHRTPSGTFTRMSPTTFHSPTHSEFMRLPSYAQQPFPPTGEQHATTTVQNSHVRKLSDITDGTSRELPPLQRPLPDENDPFIMKVPTADAHGETPQSMDGVQSIKQTDPLDSTQIALQDPEDSYEAPVSPDSQQTPLLSKSFAPQARMDVILAQPEVKTETMEDVSAPDNEESVGQKAADTRDDGITNSTGHTEPMTSNAIVELKHEDSTRVSPVAAEASIPTLDTPTSLKHSTSKKRPAPKSDKKVEKKGTASAIRKPAAKKRKIETDSMDGTPFSQRSATPVSSRASKTPAPRNRKQQSVTPIQSSPAPNTSDANPDDDQDADEDSELFCVCRKPDDHTWMIACDGGCEDWFHGRCVNIDEKDGNLIDKYICPNCKEKDRGLTSWKPMCRYSPCREPARSTNKNPSKYCSDEHGIEFMRRHALVEEAKSQDKAKAATNKKRRRDNHADNTGNEDDTLNQAAVVAEDDDQTYLRGGILRASELKALSRGVKDLEEFKKLGESVLSPPRTASPDGQNLKSTDVDRMKLEKEKVVYTAEEKVQLADIDEEKERLRRRRGSLDDREKFLSLVKSRAKSVLEELKKKEGAKDICGFDSRLSWSDEEFAAWRISSKGQKALESGLLGPPSSDLSSGDYAVDTEGDEKMTNGDDSTTSESGEGVCQKKRCERHKYWYKLQQEGLAFEKDECRQQMRKIAQQEKGIVERAMIRHLEIGDGNNAIPEAGNVGGKVEQSEEVLG